MEKNTNEVCSTCGIAGLVRDTRDVPFKYKGRTHMIRGITGDYCPACGEVEMDGEGEDAERFSNEGLEFIKQVNAKLADGAFIAGVRKKLGFSQEEAGLMFGGGRNGFGRYESGRAVPPVGLVALLELLDVHPELLDEVRAKIERRWAP